MRYGGGGDGGGGDDGGGVYASANGGNMIWVCNEWMDGQLCMQEGRQREPSREQGSPKQSKVRVVHKVGREFTGAHW